MENNIIPRPWIAKENIHLTDAEGGKGAFVVVPDDMAVHSLEDFQPSPNRIVEKPTFRTTKSLADYVSRFHSPGNPPVVFSNPDTAIITAVLDYHSDAPSHCAHRPRFRAGYTPAFSAWVKINGQSMSQVSAGEFLEERATDVISPDAASIMDMVMSFDALKKVTFRQSTRLTDGNRQFTYNEENEVRGNVTMPEAIKLLLPIYEGQKPESVEVRIRYRIEDGSLRFSFRIHNFEDLKRTAFSKCEDEFLAAVKAEDLLFTHEV